MAASRANSFAHHRVYCGKYSVSSKAFMMQWLRSFMIRARGHDSCNTRSNFRKSAPKPAAKRTRMSKKQPTLPEARFDNTLTHCVVVDSDQHPVPQRACIFCRFRRAWKKLIGTPASQLPVVVRPKRQCLGCGVHLCKKCFDPYHIFPAPDYENMTFDHVEQES